MTAQVDGLPNDQIQRDKEQENDDRPIVLYLFAPYTVPFLIYISYFVIKFGYLLSFQEKLVTYIAIGAVFSLSIVYRLHFKAQRSKEINVAGFGAFYPFFRLRKPSIRRV
jgi:hypothetical protein